MKAYSRGIERWTGLAVLLALAGCSLGAQDEPGKRVSLGRYSLNIHCTGVGNPVVVIETGLGDFAFDWALVQERLEHTNRVCTYDRAGYASSDTGPMPRTFAQLNLELHELLQRTGEKPPYVLVGHSFGGAVVRNYAARYPDEVAGMVLAESITEHQPLVFGGKPNLLKDSATGRSVPAPSLTNAIQPVQEKENSSQEPLPKIYSVLPVRLQQLHRQFATKAALDAAEGSQRDWSSEYYAEWDRHPQTALLGSKPLIILTRAMPGFDPSPNYDVDRVDGQRLRAQTELLSLSSNSLQIVLPMGHNLHLECPDEVAWAIRLVAVAGLEHVSIARIR